MFIKSILKSVEVPTYFMNVVDVKWVFRTVELLLFLKIHNEKLMF